MADLKRRNRAYACFGLLGAAVGLLTLWEIDIGQEAFLMALGFGFFFFGPLLLAMAAVASAGIAYAIVQCPRDPVLLFLAAATAPFTVFGLNNVLYVYDPWVVANDLVEGISLLYAAVTIALALDWFIRRQRVRAP